MLRSRGPLPASALALLFGGWTLFVWVGRLRNLVTEPGSVLDASRWSLVGSLAFTVLGLVVVSAVGSGWSGRSGSLLGPAVTALGALTVLVWVVRAVDIAGGDHSVGFIVVHLVLAGISIGLAGVAFFGLRRPDGGAVATSSPMPGRATVGYPPSDG